jgi:hypothetical protein
MWSADHCSKCSLQTAFGRLQLADRFREVQVAMAAGAAVAVAWLPLVLQRCDWVNRTPCGSCVSSSCGVPMFVMRMHGCMIV